MRALLLATLLALAGVGARGQSLIVEPTPAMAAELARLVRPRLPAALLPDGSAVGPETPEQAAADVVPPELALTIVRRGTLTGEMEVCGMDCAAESFLPFMQGLRAEWRWTARQVAFAGLLHGAAQG